MRWSEVSSRACLEKIQDTPDLTKLSKLLEFAANTMAMAKIPSPQRLRGAKQELFILVVAAHNYIESVCDLCNKGGTPAAFVLLRPICECLIKSRYLYCNPRLHLWELRLEALMEKRKRLNGMKSFFMSDRSTDVHQKNLSIEAIKSREDQLCHSIDYSKSRFEKHGGKFNKKGNPLIKGILSKAEYVDTHNLAKGMKSESLAYLYHLVYRQLSSGVHLDSLNFSEFSDWDKDGCEVYLSGNFKNVPIVARLAMWFYRELTHQFFTIYRIPCIREMNGILRNG